MNPEFSVKQEYLSKEQISTMILNGLPKGRYEINVGPDGKARFSAIRPIWIQSEGPVIASVPA